MGLRPRASDRLPKAGLNKNCITAKTVDNTPPQRVAVAKLACGSTSSINAGKTGIIIPTPIPSSNMVKSTTANAGLDLGAAVAMSAFILLNNLVDHLGQVSRCRKERGMRSVHVIHILCGPLFDHGRLIFWRYGLIICTANIGFGDAMIAVGQCDRRGLGCDGLNTQVLTCQFNRICGAVVIKHPLDMV